MSDSFSIERATLAGLAPGVLHEEIRSHTGSEAATESILRSMERFGSDESIRYYEVTSKAGPRTRHNGARATWTVRAVR